MNVQEREVMQMALDALENHSGNYKQVALTRKVEAAHGINIDAAIAAKDSKL